MITFRVKSCLHVRRGSDLLAIDVEGTGIE